MTTGLVLGKFLPPHAGHVFLVEFARRFADELTVVVGSLAAEPIDGALRHRWMTELFPGVHVLHLEEELPQTPDDHPGFWALWRTALRRCHPAPLDYVFASDAYGARLAEELGARWIPLDPAREMLPVSGSAVREDPLRHWNRIPGVVRPHFVKRVCIFGAESTGKSTLARDLARHYQTVHVTEFARGLIDARKNEVVYEDIALFARGQAAAEEALAREANRVLFCDTDLLTTAIWSETLFGRVPEGLREAALARRYDLTLVPDIDTPWVDDPQRFLPHARREFMDRCLGALAAAGRRHLVISGSWEERFRRAVEETERLLG
jgi:NadR type nicotinamide-nucleotide adenylyltransferase